MLITAYGKKINKDSISIQDLIGEEIILREEGSGTRQIIENALKEKELDLNVFKSKSSLKKERLVKQKRLVKP